MMGFVSIFWVEDFGVFSYIWGLYRFQFSHDLKFMHLITMEHCVAIHGTTYPFLVLVVVVSLGWNEIRVHFWDWHWKSSLNFMSYQIKTTTST